MRKVAAAVIEDGAKVLVARRKPGGRFGGLWEFPGGKVEAGETPQAALVREIKEEMGLTIEVGESLGLFPFRSSENPFGLLAFRATVRGGEIGLADHDRFRWSRPSELDPSEFAPADVPLVEKLKERPGPPGRPRGRD